MKIAQLIKIDSKNNNIWVLEEMLQMLLTQTTVSKSSSIKKLKKNISIFRPTFVHKINEAKGWRDYPAHLLQKLPKIELWKC